MKMKGMRKQGTAVALYGERMMLTTPDKANETHRKMFKRSLSNFSFKPRFPAAPRNISPTKARASLKVAKKPVKLSILFLHRPPMPTPPFKAFGKNAS
ncbi:MAG: hypothetical protein K6U03_05085 [Firmicutes bacterium]|nr:hypothetical protein [Bacillota bacterium]